MSRAAFSSLLAAFLLAGCAEMRSPPPAPVFGTASVEPVREAAADAAQAFGEGRFAGAPARTARAAAQLEWLNHEIARDPRWASLPVSVGTNLRAARSEVRLALGIAPDANSEAAARALASAAGALDRQDIPAAAAALSPPLFRPGGNVTLARLTSPGDLPYARNATLEAQLAIDRMARTQGGGLAAAMDQNVLGGLTGLR